MQASYTKQAGWPSLPDGFAFRMVSKIAGDSLGIHVDAAGSIHVADPVAENAAARPAKHLGA
jgi:hypothetical protein